jgi:dihydrofolate reductase
MNLILTKSMNLDNDNVKTFSDIENIINFTKERNFHDVWIIGGKQIYELFLTKYLNIIDEIHITKIKGNFNCDVHLDINNYLLNFELSKTIAYNDCVIFNHEKYKGL